MGNCFSYTLILLVFIVLSLPSCKKRSLDSEIGMKILAVTSSINSQASCIVYRLADSYPDLDATKMGEYLHGYEIVSGPIDLSIENQKALHSIIESRSTYIEHAVPVDCSFLPGVAFCFADKQTWLDLLVCFTCSELRYYLNGEVFWQSYFKPNELKDFVKKLYPKDAKIQSLN